MRRFFFCLVSVTASISVAQDAPVVPAPKDVALIVGIEKYAFVEKVPGAKQSALDWSDYLKQRGATTYLLLDNEATGDRMLDAAKKVVADSAAGARVWFVFIGHGAPMPPKVDAEGKLGEGESGLVGVDAQQDAKSLQNRSVSLPVLLAELSKGTQRETIAIIDACFSGKTSRGSLAPGLQPLIALRSTPKPRVVQLSAGRSDEFAGPLPGYGRPAFSHLVLGGLRGWADQNTDGVVTSGEAVEYARGVLQRVLTDRSQTPELVGENVQLGQSLGEKGPTLEEFQTKAREASVMAVSADGTVVDTGKRTAGWVLVGTGGALGVLGLVLGQVAAGSARDAVGEQSAAKSTSLYEGAKTTALFSDISSGLAVASGVTGLILVLTSTSWAPVSVGPVVTPSMTGAVVTGTF